MKKKRKLDSILPEQVPYQFFTDRVHPGDYERTREAKCSHLCGDAHVYEVEYRIQAKDGSWRWYYDRVSITVRDEHGPQAQRRDPRVDRHGGEVYVYRRAGQPCLVCGTEIRTAVLEGRNLYWCSRCQRRRRAPAAH